MKIYVQLLDEGTEVWRPVEAVHIQDDLYRITGANEQPDDECWPFSAGSVVRCETKRTKEADLILVAIEQVKDAHQS